jgi:aminopeptidase N
MSPADPVALHAAKQALLAALGEALQKEIDAALSPSGRARLSASAGGRALLNQMLVLGVAAGNATAIAGAEVQVLDQNMTLSQGALRALINCENQARVIALQAFHDRWQSSALVMEKWFQMEAMSAVGGTIERLAALMKHPAFDWNNPNKLRSVLGAFMAGNPMRFYATDGSGYRFVASCLIDIDRRNPQVAARMVLPLTRMAAYDAERQLRMTAALQTIAAASPSNDLGEVVDKALTANG